MSGVWRQFTVSTTDIRRKRNYTEHVIKKKKHFTVQERLCNYIQNSRKYHHVTMRVSQPAP